MLRVVLRFREVIQHSIFVFDVLCNINSLPQEYIGYIFINLKNDSVYIGIDEAIKKKWEIESSNLADVAWQEAENLAKFLNGGAQG